MKNKQKGLKKEKAKAALLSSTDLMKIFLDPVAGFLKGAILNEYDGEHLMFHYSNGLALIEKDGETAKKVIENTIAQVRHVEPAIDFMITDFKYNKQKRYLQTVRAKLNKVVTSYEKNHLTIHVLDNIVDFLEDKETYRIFNKLFYNLPFYNIFIFNEQSYKRFAQLFDHYYEVHEVWINRQPGEMDFFNKEQKHSHERLNQVYINNTIFTSQALKLIERARIETQLLDDEEIDPAALLSAAAEGTETGLALMQCHNLSEDKLALIRKYPFEPFKSLKSENAYLFSITGAEVIKTAVKLASASGYPDHNNPGLVSDFHIICALAMQGRTAEPSLRNRKLNFDNAARKIGDWYYRKKISPSLRDKKNYLFSIGCVQGLFRELQGSCFGQRQALEALRELLCNSLLKPGDSARPNYLDNHMLFLGPENVGKMHLARLYADKLGRPFYSFDMCYFNETDLQSVCTAVKNNRDVVIALENIEKASPAMISFVCRLIDSGQLVYENETFDFSSVTIVLISSIDKSLSNILYNKGYRELDQKKHVDSIISLINKQNPISGKPYLPLELTSRIAKDQLILFNSLQVEDLLNICEKKLTQHCKLIEDKLELRITCDPLLSYVITCSEGGRPAPREIDAAVENLLNREAEKFVDGKSSSSTEIILREFDRVHFALPDQQYISKEVVDLFIPVEKPRVLLLTDIINADFYACNIDSVKWHPVYSIEELESIKSYTDYDYALLDLWCNDKCTVTDRTNIIKNFTHYRGSEISRLPLEVITQKMFGARYLQLIKELGKQLPVIMLNLKDEVWEKHALEGSNCPTSAFLDAAELLSIIEDNRSHDYIRQYSYFRYDLYFDMLLSIKSKGSINTVFSAGNYAFNGINTAKGNAFSLREAKAQFGHTLEMLHNKLHREKRALDMAFCKQFLGFETEWEFDDKYKLVTVRLKNLQLHN